MTIAILFWTENSPLQSTMLSLLSAYENSYLLKFSILKNP